MTAEPVFLIFAIEHFANFPRQGALTHGDGTWNDNARTVTGTRKHRRADSAQLQLLGTPVGWWAAS